MGGQYFGFKDPRTVRLMPVWHQIFKGGAVPAQSRTVECNRATPSFQRGASNSQA